MKARVKFRKDGPVKFVGHLDTMRFFQKMIRRAEIPIEYSKGFNPHMIMSFASPLGIGITSEGEYFDIELNEPISSEEAIMRMNATTVDGVEVLSFNKIPPEKKKNCMTILTGAGYLVKQNSSGWPLQKSTKIGKVLEEDKDLGEVINSFMAQSEIKILKKTKRSEETVDIKPMIYSIKAIEDTSIEMILAAGSKENLKPELVMKALYTFLGIKYDAFHFNVHRTEMYTDVGENGERKLVSLESLGTRI